MIPTPDFVPMTKPGQRLVSGLIESESADAVVVLYTKVVRGNTVAVSATFGNAFSCRGLIETAADALYPEEVDDGEDE
tara:strand:+ start:1207 stop:1440 length:234 start_codon:yes stop_codon:yes gene_type:complete